METLGIPGRPARPMVVLRSGAKCCLPALLFPEGAMLPPLTGTREVMSVKRT